MALEIYYWRTSLISNSENYPPVGRASRRGLIVRDRFVLTMTRGDQPFGGNTFLHQVGLYRSGSFFRELLVYLWRARIIRVPFNGHVDLWMFIHDHHTLIQFCHCRLCQRGASGNELNLLRIELVFFQLRTTEILRQAFFIGTLIVFVRNAVTIGIHQRATLVAG